jgi:hypothetical protein
MRSQPLISLVDRLFLVDEDVKFSTKSLANLKIDHVFIEQYLNLGKKCDEILMRIKARKEKIESQKCTERG